MRPVLALNCLLQIEQERSEEEISVGDALALAFRPLCTLKIEKKYHNHETQQTKALRKHAYSNILKILPPKNENFQIKFLYIFHISAQNIDCGYPLEPPRRGGSNEYPQSVF